MEKRDIVIIGGGPAGTTTAVFLKERGYNPLLLERADFPRFHVGESLVPATQAIWERLGIADELEHSHYEFKFAARVMLADDDKDGRVHSMTVRFPNVPYGRAPFRPFAYQVERAKFDSQLLANAVKRGVEVRKAAVLGVTFDGERATGVTLRGPDGAVETIEADFVIDASGRQAVIARQLNLLELDPVIRTSACFGHFEKVKRESGQGFFEGYLIENGWVWFIPFVDNGMSFGVVQNRPQSLEWPHDPDEVLLGTIERYPWLRRRFEGASRRGEARMVRDLAYHSRRLAGDGWLALGDAAFFVDPLFSTGVHIAFFSGEEGAKAVDAFLKSGRDLKVLQAYEKRFLRYHRSTNSFVQHVYQLFRYRLAVRLMIWWCGEARHDFNDWLLRRVVYWLSGNYESYKPVVAWLKFVMRCGAAFCKAYAAITGRGRWQTPRPLTAEAPPLSAK